MSAPPSNPDRRPLPPDVDSLFDPLRGVWFYVDRRSFPPRISYIHPADEVAQYQQQASPQPQQQRTIYIQTSPLQHQPNPGNGLTPWAQVYRKRITKAQELYSSVNHPYSSHPSPEDEPRHPLPTNGPSQNGISQNGPLPSDFDPYLGYEGTSPGLSSSSTNPSTHLSPTSMSPTIRPPEVPNSGYSFNRPRHGRSASLNGRGPFTEEGGENFREQSLFERAPRQSNSITPRVLEQPINIKPRLMKSATMPAVGTNELPLGVFMKPKAVPVYTLTARPPSSIGFSQQTSQPTSPQSLPSGAAAPWMASGMTYPTSPTAVPVLAPTSPTGVMAQPIQNVVQKSLPPTPSPSEGHGQSKTNGKASKGATVGKAIAKATAKAALGIVMPSSVANLAVNAGAAGIEGAIKARKKAKATKAQQPVPVMQETIAAQSQSPLYPTNPEQFYQQTHQFANYQPQQQQYGMVQQPGIAVPQTQVAPQRHSSTLFNSMAGAATRAVVSTTMNAALNSFSGTTEPSSNILSFIGGEE